MASLQIQTIPMQHALPATSKSGLLRQPAHTQLKPACIKLENSRSLSARSPVATRCSAQSGASARSTVPPVAVPTSADATVEQAVQTVLRAWRDGINRQQIQYLIPLIGATELDDWPGGIRQQFKAATPMLEQMLLSIKKEDGLTGPLNTAILDEGDAVGAWTGPSLAAVLFPTAETLKQIRTIAEERSNGLTVLANPQWQGGQAISDFGFGPWKARNEEFVSSFKQTYCFKQMRVQGEDVRVLYAYPGKWQIHVAEDDGSLPLVWSGDEVPPYAELEAMLRKRPNSKASMGWAQRLQREIEFNMKQ